MFCPYCGKQIPEVAKFCTSCGRKIPPIAQPAIGAAVPQSTVQQAEPMHSSQLTMQPAVQQTAQPATRQPAQFQPDAGLPPNVFYDDRGNLVWICRIQEDPEKLAAIAEATGNKPRPLWQRCEFTDTCLDCYLREGRNERAAASPKKFSKMELLGDIADLVLNDAINNDSFNDNRLGDQDDTVSEIAQSYAYRKMKEIRPVASEGKIYLKCGFKNRSVQIAPEQIDFVVAELRRRCPQARII
ncbi:MAG: zinc-ribbon domain-containing protein [Eggerthellaceae bacterium]|nr:zinc-ribbon domain-containing protein [Eggerthellaceae bacterium]